MHAGQGSVAISQSTISQSVLICPFPVPSAKSLQGVRCDVWWQAVAHGKWLVIEDLNLAPPEVLAALVPLLGSRQLHLPQRAQVVNAAPGFQLLASITTAPGDPPSASQPLTGLAATALLSVLLVCSAIQVSRQQDLSEPVALRVQIASSATAGVILLDVKVKTVSHC